MCGKVTKNHHKVDLYLPDEKVKTFNTNLMRNFVSFRRTFRMRFGPDRLGSFGPVLFVAKPIQIITKWTCTSQRKK